MDFDASKCVEYLNQQLLDVELTLQSIKTKINSLSATENTIKTLTEHPRIDGILKIEDTFAFPGQVVTSGEVFLTVGDYKISLTPEQALKHLRNQLKLTGDSRDACLRQKGNVVEKLKMTDVVFGQKQVGGEVQVDDKTVGRVFECGEFLEIVEFEQSDLESRIDNLKIGENKKRVAKVKNEEEKQLWLTKRL